MIEVELKTLGTSQGHAHYESEFQRPSRWAEAVALVWPWWSG